MNLRRLSIQPAPLLAAFGFALALASSAANAQVANTTSTIVLPVSATVGAGLSLTGNVEVTAVVVPDFDFGHPASVHTEVKFVNLTGQNRAGTSYTVNYRVDKIRPVAVKDVLDVTIPITTTDWLAQPPFQAQATVTLNYDSASNTARLTSGSVAFGATK